MKKSFDVVGFGALNLDRLYRVDRIAEPGEHEKILEAFEAPGGSAANTVAGLARLGLKTGFVGAVGNDSAGEVLLGDFRKRKVDVKGVKVYNSSSGTIIGFIDSCGERTLYPFPAANNLLQEKDVRADIIRKAKILHMTSFVGDKQFGLQKKIINKLGDTILSFSPGDLYTRKGLSALRPFIKKSGIVFLNDSEIRQLTSKGYIEGANILLSEGADMVVVTLGELGSYVATEKESHHVPAKKTKPIDTTGAGDAYAAGFLYSIIRGKTIRDAARNGNKSASVCIMGVGARTLLACAKDLK